MLYLIDNGFTISMEVCNGKSPKWVLHLKVDIRSLPNNVSGLHFIIWSNELNSGSQVKTISE